MKIFLTLGLALLIGAAAPAQQEPAAASVPQWEREFLNLSEERRTEFVKHVQRAQELAAEKRVFEAVDAIDKAAKIFPDHPGLLNLRGSCQVEFRNFERAMEAYRKADELAPDNAGIVFNIAEVHFVTNEWEKAKDGFERVLELTEGAENTMQLRRLAEFKVMLCMLKLDQVESARKLAEKYDLFDDSPFPYYAAAAIHYHDEEKVEAEADLARAARIFRKPETLAPWQDTLMEFGYIKNFFTGDLEEDAGTPPIEP